MKYLPSFFPRKGKIKMVLAFWRLNKVNWLSYYFPTKILSFDHYLHHLSLIIVSDFFRAGKIICLEHKMWMNTHSFELMILSKFSNTSSRFASSWDHKKYRKNHCAWREASPLRSQPHRASKSPKSHKFINLSSLKKIFPRRIIRAWK